MSSMKIAVIGSGISGLICAHLLKDQTDLTLFEAADKPGGHVNTVDVHGKTGDFAVDTGFIVFNEQNYPNFVKLIDQLGVESQTTRMGFSVRSEELGLEYSGEGLKGMFGNIRNFTDYRHWGMVRDILRFHKEAEQATDPTETVESFLLRHKFGRRFTEMYLLPLGSALWSCSIDRFGSFPMEFVTDFLANHQMLQVRNRPIWRVLKGGSRTYVDKIIKQLGDRLKLSCPIHKIVRTEEGIEVKLPDGHVERFDEVILACHADQSLRLIDSPTSEETTVLRSFPYEENIVTLHSDDSVLPRRPASRASWNAYLPSEKREHAIVTYDMNILQSLPTEEPFCVSLNQRNSINPRLEHQTFNFSHPTYHSGRKEAQRRHKEFIRNKGISLCGAYWGYGFHEDGLTSGLRVCEAFGASL
jgi:predicted NAD/FAD-binding protein